MRTLGAPAAGLMQDSDHAFPARPWHLLRPTALHLPWYPNSGLFMFRRDAFDLEYLE